MNAAQAGPFGSEREARAAAHQLGGPPRHGWSILSSGQNRRMLDAACEAAGVSLGTHDARILDWLAGFEDSTCAVVAGLILRAHAAAADTAPPGPGPVLDSEPWTCRDCGGQFIGQRTPDDLCATCLSFLLSGDGQ